MCCMGSRKVLPLRTAYVCICVVSKLLFLNVVFFIHFLIHFIHFYSILCVLTVRNVIIYIHIVCMCIVYNTTTKIPNSSDEFQNYKNIYTISWRRFVERVKTENTYRCSSNIFVVFFFGKSHGCEWCVIGYKIFCRYSLKLKIRNYKINM